MYVMSLDYNVLCNQTLWWAWCLVATQVSLDSPEDYWYVLVYSDTVINPIIDVLCTHTHIHVCMLLPDIDECSGDADMPTTVSPL